MSAAALRGSQFKRASFEISVTNLIKGVKIHEFDKKVAF